jgi:hypothetical protein
MNNFFVLPSHFFTPFSVYLHIGAFAPVYHLGIFVDAHDMVEVVRRIRQSNILFTFLLMMSCIILIDSCLFINKSD